ncbi:Peptidyl-prolyl cis-trans isomerase B [Thalassoglobus neptunius]|uniref:peptidylprolyl isomerase n=1 Tax=Thalassoglobus neptunius TaxID=1938619 RepID=A0A5C5WIS3_9PLAN|nr:peptidylprolyl isomerase [Thalassoglobus neptunius]TWT50029.1 Peptidyl-prolyl cis-trans isomerase B [Thalassoglobus neptunius]
MIRMLQSMTINLTLLSMLCLTQPLIAQDASPQKSWEELVKVRNESFARLKEIQNTVREASPEDRQTLTIEYATIVQRMQNDVIPPLMKLVPAQIESNPDDAETREIAAEMMRYAFARNDYPIAIVMANALLKGEPSNKLAINILGISQFADHQFEDANRVLTLAEERGDLIPDLGGRYIDNTKSYIDYWKAEKKIREAEAAAQGEDALPRVKFTTPKGEIILELFENEAPNTVANFVNLVESGFYNGLKFHRVLAGFMAQGGCPHSKDGDPGQPGTGGPGYTIKCEAYRPDARRHFAGTLSMAHAGRDTGGSQFFITHLPTPHLDQEIAPTSVHTVFGRVLEGLDVARALQQEDEIISAEVIRKRNHDYIPKTTPE